MVYVKVKKQKKKCKYCEKIFYGRKSKLCCSHNCSVMWNRYNKPKSETHKKKCLWCGDIFMALRVCNKYCCDNCSHHYRRYEDDKRRNTERKLRESKRKKCGYCGNRFYMKQTNQRCCSRVCYERYYEKFKRDGAKARFRAKRYYWQHRNERLAKQYNITIDQYKELTRKCYFCEFDEIVDCHHIIPLKQGGENKLGNYIGLCPNHHKLLHLRDYKLVKENGKWKIVKK